MPILTPTAVFVYFDDETKYFETRSTDTDIDKSQNFDLLKKRTTKFLKDHGLAPVFINAFRALELPETGVCGT
jgi:hypothetical protein